MSVLNQSGEEQVECPLCMEPLEVDDLNFFPCSCGYQICRFCWHRIRTDENGLCPACRKAYSENPADFTPLSKEQVAQLKAEKRQRDQQRKAKLSESRKHLASVRVVQRNLVFVVGLPMRLADPDMLKKHEYFGKFGKIHKVVINQSPQYAGTQGNSASAYVTYMKSDDALKAIQNVNNITLDGRQIKSSLGTTKYCSHFMKNQPCPKPDCMYLHDFGDPEASFTKEQMHAGKHQEYEKKLHEALLSKLAVQAQLPATDAKPPAPQQTAKNCKDTSSSNTANAAATNNGTNKENWPQLNQEKDGKTDKKTDKTEKESKCKSKAKTKSINNNNNNNVDRKFEKVKSCEAGCQNFSQKSMLLQQTDKIQDMGKSKEDKEGDRGMDAGTDGLSKLPMVDDNSSFFSQNIFQKLLPEHGGGEEETHRTAADSVLNQISSELNESLLINSTEDWEAAFGFTRHSNHLEELAKQRNNIKDTLETFGNSYITQNEQHNFSPISENYHHNHQQQQQQHSPISQQQINYDMKNILDALANNKSVGQNNFYKQEDRLKNHFIGMLGHTKEINGLNGVNGGVNGINGLGQDVSKFFTDFASRNGINKETSYPIQPANGLSHHNANLYLQKLEQENHFLMMQRQQQLEEQLVNMNLKQNYCSPNGRQYMNGDMMGSNGSGYLPMHGNQMYSGVGHLGKQNRIQTEDELDFDPFQETQKALAELIETEQNVKMHNTVRSGIPPSQQLNGLVHNQNVSNQLIQPPPGFVQPQPNTHMNSFGSKILPYLNMGSSSSQQQQQQILGSNSTQNNWPPSYSQIQHNKGTDWKFLDPAIVSSSRHYPLANHYSNTSAMHLGSSQHQQTPMRSFDFTNNTFSNFAQQIQQQPNGFASQQNLNSWLGSDLNTKISSPPGFRSANTKQQEC